MTPQEQLLKFRESQNKQLSPQEQLKQFRASQSNGSSLGIKRAGTFADLISPSTQDEQMFDYEKGAKGGLRAKLSFMETAEEKENFLRNRVGEDGYTKDSKGNLALTEVGQSKEGMEPIGKNLIIDEKGFSLRDISDLAGLAPETVGSVVGGILGAPGLITGAVGAAAGAAVGQTVEEGIESLLGLQKQTGAEVAKDVAKEAALAGTIDLVTVGTFKAVRGLIGQAGKGANLAARSLGQQQKQLGQKQAELGIKIMDSEVPGIPSYESVGLPASISRASQIAKSISGSQQQAIQNVSFALNKKNKLLEKAGVKFDPTTGSPIDDLAKVISDSAPPLAKKLQDDLLKSQQAHISAIDDTIRLLTKSTKEGSEIDDSVLEILMKNYDEFAQGANQSYKLVDDKLAEITGDININGRITTGTGGELPIFNIKALNTKFNDIIDSKYGGASSVAPEQFTLIGSQIKELVNKGAQKGFTTFNGLRGLRKNIQDTLMDPRLSIGDSTPRRLLVTMRSDIDDMLQGRVQLTGVGSSANAKLMRSAMDLLQDANKSYRADIRLYNKLERLGIVRNFGEPGVNVKLEVGRNYDKIIASPDRIDAAIKAAKGNEDVVRQDLAKRFIDDALLDANKDFADPTKFNAIQFNNKIKKAQKDKTGQLLFGDDWNKVQQLSKALSEGGVKSIDENIIRRISQLNVDRGVVQTLEDVAKAQRELDNVNAVSFLKKLNSGQIDAEEAAKAITKKDIGSSNLTKALNFFDTVPEVKENVRKAIINDLLGSVDENIFVDVRAASSLKNAIDSYKPELLKRMLGEQELKDINEFSEMLILLSDTGKKGAGSLAADAIRTGQFTNPMTNLPKVARFKVINHFLNNPAVVRKALEVKAGRTDLDAAAQAVTQTLNDSVRNTTGSGAEEIVENVGKKLSTLNRSQVGTRQLGGRVLDQQLGITREKQGQGIPPLPKQEDVVSNFSMPNLTIQDQRNIQPPQVNLRQRAARNPYLAASLLGGLGSASLLNR